MHTHIDVRIIDVRVRLHKEYIQAQHTRRMENGVEQKTRDNKGPAVRTSGLWYQCHSHQVAAGGDY